MALRRTILLAFIASLAIPALRIEAEHFDPGGMTSLKVKPIEERQVRPDDVSIAVWPTALIDADRAHYLNQSTPTIMIFAPANPLGRSLQQGWLVFDLPAGIELIASNAYLAWHLLKREEIERDGRLYTRHEVSCSVHPTTFPRGRGRGAWFQRYRPPALWLKTELAPGTKPGKVFYPFPLPGQGR